MPTDNKETAPAVAQNAIPDARDKRITELEGQVAKLTEQLAASSKKAKLPTGVAILEDGKQLKIIRTVQAKFALDEVKKGFLEEDLDLIVTERG